MVEALSDGCAFLCVAFNKESDRFAVGITGDKQHRGVQGLNSTVNGGQRKSKLVAEVTGREDFVFGVGKEEGGLDSGVTICQPSQVRGRCCFINLFLGFLPDKVVVVILEDFFNHHIGRQPGSKFFHRTHLGSGYPDHGNDQT